MNAQQEAGRKHMQAELGRRRRTCLTPSWMKRSQLHCPQSWRWARGQQTLSLGVPGLGATAAEQRCGTPAAFAVA